jgi:antitoxin VapB
MSHLLGKQRNGALLYLTRYISWYIFHSGGHIMQTAKLFQNGRSQAVRLPKEFQFKGREVFIQKHGDAVLLIPHEKAWKVFLEGLSSFSADFMQEGRNQGKDQKRARL